MPRMHRDRIACDACSRPCAGDGGKCTPRSAAGGDGAPQTPRAQKSRRTFIQLAAAVLFNGYAAGFAHGKIFTGGAKAFCVPVLNCYSCPGALGACPVGALQQSLGGVDRHFPFYVLGSLMVFGILLGRLICGFLCPFGLVQDLLHRIPAPKLRVPRALDRVLRWGKYVMLFGVVVLLSLLVTDAMGVTPPFFCEFVCPAGTLGAGIPLVLGDGSLRQLLGALFNWKLLVLLAILAAAVLIPRPFCRYLCPLGAFYGLFNRWSFYRMRVDAATCVNCGACEQACPMAVDPRANANSHECIRCGACRHACPTSAITAGWEWTAEKPSCQRER